MATYVNNKLARLVLKLLDGVEKSDSITVKDISIISGNTKNIVNVLSDFIDSYENSLKYGQSDFSKAKMIFVAIKGSIVGLYKHGDVYNESFSFRDDKQSFYVAGEVITPFCSIGATDALPDMPVEIIDGLVSIDLNIDENEITNDLFDDNNIIITDEECVKLVPLVYELINATGRVDLTDNNINLDSFINRYDNIKSNIEIVEHEDGTVTYDIETGGLGMDYKLFKEIPEPDLPKSNGNLFSV